MRKPRVSPLATSALVALVTALAIAPPPHAQMAGDGFLFHRPNARIAIRGGYALASAGSDLFEFTTEQLTLDKRDFSSLSFGASLGFAATDRLDLTLDAGVCWLNQVARLNPATSHVIRAWDCAGENDFELRSAFLTVLKDHRQRRTATAEPANRVAELVNS